MSGSARNYLIALYLASRMNFTLTISNITLSKILMRDLVAGGISEHQLPRLKQKLRVLM